MHGWDHCSSKTVILIQQPQCWNTKGQPPRAPPAAEGEGCAWAPPPGVLSRLSTKWVPTPFTRHIPGLLRRSWLILMRDMPFQLPPPTYAKRSLMCPPAWPDLHQRDRTPATWLAFHTDSWEIRDASCACNTRGNKTAPLGAVWIHSPFICIDVWIHNPFIFNIICHLAFYFISSGLDSETRITIFLTSNFTNYDNSKCVKV